MMWGCQIVDWTSSLISAYAYTVCVATLTVWMPWKHKTSDTFSEEFKPKCEPLTSEKNTQCCRCMCVCVCVLVHLWPRALTERSKTLTEVNTHIYPQFITTHTPNTVMKIPLQSHPALTTWQISTNQIKKESMRREATHTHMHAHTHAAVFALSHVNWGKDGFFPQERRCFKYRGCCTYTQNIILAAAGDSRSWELILLRAAGLLSQRLGASRSILDSNPLKNNLLMCPRKIQFQHVSGQYNFITRSKFQANVVLINMQCLCVVLRGHKMDCVAFYFHLFTACMSNFSQSTGLKGTTECDLHNTEISLVICCFGVFASSLGVCWEWASTSVSVARGKGSWQWSLSSGKVIRLTHKKWVCVFIDISALQIKPLFWFWCYLWHAKTS